MKKTYRATEVEIFINGVKLQDQLEEPPFLSNSNPPIIARKEIVLKGFIERKKAPPKRG